MTASHETDRQRAQRIMRKSDEWQMTPRWIGLRDLLEREFAAVRREQNEAAAAAADGFWGGYIAERIRALVPKP